MNTAECMSRCVSNEARGRDRTAEILALGPLCPQFSSCDGWGRGAANLREDTGLVRSGSEGNLLFHLHWSLLHYAQAGVAAGSGGDGGVSGAGELRLVWALQQLHSCKDLGSPHRLQGALGRL